jgi:hypothetical protein
MKLFALLVSSSLLLFAADDAWKRVRDLRSGAEVKVLKVGVKNPITAKFDEANDERMVIVVKNEQTSIAKDDVLKVEARKQEPSVRREQKTTNTDPNAQLSQPRVPNPGQRATPALQESSSGVTFSKPGFELIYEKGKK